MTEILTSCRNFNFWRRTLLNVVEEENNYIYMGKATPESLIFGQCEKLETVRRASPPTIWYIYTNNKRIGQHHGSPKNSHPHISCMVYIHPSHTGTVLPHCESRQPANLIMMFQTWCLILSFSLTWIIKLSPGVWNKIMWVWCCEGREGWLQASCTALCVVRLDARIVPLRV